MASIHYTIVVSGERLILTKDQIKSEPDSYFATYFLGDFAEAISGVKELVIEKEPLLFKLMQAHMRGYEILPLSTAAIPSYMTKDTALTNLLTEARFYGLEQLVEKIVEFQSKDAIAKATPHGRNYVIQFRRRTTSAWSTRVIDEELYKIYLNRYMHLQRTYMTPDPRGMDGWVVHASWMEPMSEDPTEPMSVCRLMVGYHSVETTGTT